MSAKLKLRRVGSLVEVTLTVEEQRVVFLIDEKNLAKHILECQELLAELRHA